MSDPVSALKGATFEGPLVSIKEHGPTGMVTIRGDLSDAAVRAAVEAACGAPVPDVRRFAANGAAAGGLGWMSPDELLWIGDYAAAPGVAAALSEALAGTHHMAEVVSDARAVFTVSGPGARELIAKGAPVDMAPAAFGAGDLRRTHIGQVAAAFWMGGDAAQGFTLICFRSYAAYVMDWLSASARDGATPGLF